MIGKLIGAAVGRRVAGRYEGTQGAILGFLAPVLLKRAFGPLGLAVGGAYLAKRFYDSRKRRTGSSY